MVCVHVINGGLFRSTVKIHPNNGKVLRQNPALSARHQTMTRADFFCSAALSGFPKQKYFHLALFFFNLNDLELLLLLCDEWDIFLVNVSAR